MLLRYTLKMEGARLRDPLDADGRQAAVERVLVELPVEESGEEDDGRAAHWAHLQGAGSRLSSKDRHSKGVTHGAPPMGGYETPRPRDGGSRCRRPQPRR